MALYDTIGGGYATYRRADPRIAVAIERALGDAESVVNVGAGAGSYEPRGRRGVGVEPSEVMIRQRGAGAWPCVQGVAEALPVESRSVDAAMAVLTAHHWSDVERGVREMARVARRRVVMVTWVPDLPSEGRAFWLTRDYFPEILEYDRRVFPSSRELVAMFERVVGRVSVEVLPIPHDCVDGMLCAYWRRPELYLEAERRAVMSSFARIDARAGLEKLRGDLESGRWMQRNGELMGLESLDCGYRVVVGEVGARGRNEHTITRT